ncbi:MAG: NERD domain-containing protein, partial [Actinobacteria bacterium]|nr:NERD domain-containing protein [Actinomycetota bacterium]
MRPDSHRWVTVSPSRFPHEDAGLRYLGEHLPDTEPYRLWTNLVLGDDEVDALVLGPAGLYLLELKYIRGQITGDDYRWVVESPGRHQPEEISHPFSATALKAKKLSSYLRRKAQEKGAAGSVQHVPWVHAAVFLHHPEVSYEIPQRDHTVFGLDGTAAQPGLPSIISLLKRSAFGGPGPAGIPGKKRNVTPQQAADLTRLMTDVGLSRPVTRVVADYRLESRPVADGPGWQDFIGTLSSFPTDKKLVRWYDTGRAEGATRRAQLERAAQREYALGLVHEGILSPLPGGFHHDPELGPALIY